MHILIALVCMTGDVASCEVAPSPYGLFSSYEACEEKGIAAANEFNANPLPLARITYMCLPVGGEST